jgi:uncharacterized protein
MRFILIKVFLFLFIFFRFFSHSFAQSEITKIEINKNIVFAEVAKDPLLRQLGLKFRAQLPQDAGMLFIFDYPGVYGFVMKDVLIDLDIAFIDENLNITQIEKMLKGEEKAIYSKNKVLFALEMNKDYFESHNIHAGDKLIVKGGQRPFN